MNIPYWAQRWSEGRTGFHEGRVNAFLSQQVARFGTARRVLVPLCGKTEDLAFLAARGHDVVGIEAVEEAALSFFREHGLEPTVRDGKPIRFYSAERITILVGDFFAVTKADVGQVDALYDRAALVALPPELWPRYVAHLRSLLEPRSPALFVTYTYENGAVTPPPWSVDEPALRSLMGSESVEFVGSSPADTPSFRERGVTVTELCFAVMT